MLLRQDSLLLTVNFSRLKLLHVKLLQLQLLQTRVHHRCPHGQPLRHSVFQHGRGQILFGDLETVEQQLRRGGREFPSIVAVVVGWLQGVPEAARLLRVRD